MYATKLHDQPTPNRGNNSFSGNVTLYQHVLTSTSVCSYAALASVCH